MEPMGHSVCDSWREALEEALGKEEDRILGLYLYYAVCNEVIILTR